MRIPFEAATAPQLRQYLKEAHGVDRHPNSGTTSLLKLIQELGETGDTFELAVDPGAGGAEPECTASADPAPPAPAAAPGMSPSEAAHGNSEEAFTPEKFVTTLRSMGMSEEDAYELAGLKAKAEKDKAGKRIPGKFGPEHDDMYVTVFVPTEKGKFGSAPVFTSVNGVRLDIPRGIEWPIRVPFYTMLLDAVEVQFDQVRAGPAAHERHLRARNSLAYPVELRTPEPYSRAVANEVAARAKEELASRGTTGQLAAA